MVLARKGGPKVLLLLVSGILEHPLGLLYFNFTLSFLVGNLVVFGRNKGPKLFGDGLRMNVGLSYR